ncbi:hypothetical protein AB834_00255 [PVC group bacterium (ex Bugula neritina AB1)]|nr:hypothetical protein AB834_00255 [PVC group bacterium (ex Bugula neritina AB1)]
MLYIKYIIIILFLSSELYSVSNRSIFKELTLENKDKRSESDWLEIKNKIDNFLEKLNHTDLIPDLEDSLEKISKEIVDNNISKHAIGSYLFEKISSDKDIDNLKVILKKSIKIRNIILSFTENHPNVYIDFVFRNRLRILTSFLNENINISMLKKRYIKGLTYSNVYLNHINDLGLIIKPVDENPLSLSNDSALIIELFGPKNPFHLSIEYTPHLWKILMVEQQREDSNIHLTDILISTYLKFVQETNIKPGTVPTFLAYNDVENVPTLNFIDKKNLTRGTYLKERSTIESFAKNSPLTERYIKISKIFGFKISAIALLDDTYFCQGCTTLVLKIEKSIDGDPLLNFFMFKDKLKIFLKEVSSEKTYIDKVDDFKALVLTLSTSEPIATDDIATIIIKHTKRLKKLAVEKEYLWSKFLNDPEVAKVITTISTNILDLELKNEFQDIIKKDRDLFKETKQISSHA